VSSKVDQELARIEARRAEAEPAGEARKSGVRAGVKRIAKDLMVRRHSTKR